MNKYILIVIIGLAISPNYTEASDWGAAYKCTPEELIIKSTKNFKLSNSGPDEIGFKQLPVSKNELECLVGGKKIETRVDVYGPSNAMGMGEGMVRVSYMYIDNLKIFYYMDLSTSAYDGLFTYLIQVKPKGNGSIVEICEAYLNFEGDKLVSESCSNETISR